jgi:hypothetical protein
MVTYAYAPYPLSSANCFSTHRLVCQVFERVRGESVQDYQPNFQNVQTSLTFASWINRNGTATPPISHIAVSTQWAFVACTLPSFVKRPRVANAPSAFGRYATGLNENTTEASSMPIPSFMAFTRATTSGGVPFLEELTLERKMLREVEASYVKNLTRFWD